MTIERKVFTVGDIIRCVAFSGGFRVWQVTAIILGALNQENVVCLRTLDKTDPIGGEDMCVPEELLLLAMKNGVNYIPQSLKGD